jgi:hypothetical protein
MSAGSRIPFRARVVAPALLVTLVAVACSTPPSTESAPVRPTAPAASSAPELTPLTRSVQPFARPELDLGHRDPSIPTAGSIYFEPTPQQKADRDALLTAVQDPTSPSYHKWLTPADFAARFGARPADVTRVGEWLAQQGLTLDAPSPLGTRIGFRGTSGQIETAFRTEFHDYLVHGEKHYAMATAPMVPTEMAPVVMGLRGLHDFHPRPVYSGKRKPRPQFDDPTYGLEMGPSDFATLYDTASLLAASTPIDGAGVNIAIIGQTWITPSDLTGFFTQFGLTSHITNILVPGTGPQTVTQNDPPEAELDLEWSSAVGQGANILFVYVGGDQPNFSVNDSVVYVVEKGTTLAPGVGNGGAQIMSESYAGCDAYYAGTDADVDSEIAAAANLEGITYVAGSGDWGAATCWVDGIGGIYTGPPADMPGVTAVGGTEFCSGPSPNGVGCNYTGTTAPDVQKTPFFNTTTFTALEYPNTTLLTPSMGASQEGVWNDAVSDGQPSGGGGAPSVIFPKPAYQVGVTPSDGARDVPDVALTASVDNVGYEVYENGGLTPIGGTSAATPSFAGILAMVNQAVVAKGGPLGLGNANPMLYTLFQSNGTLGAFHDIVVGDNIMPCTVGTDPNCSTGSYGGYKASAGYDLASGLGTIDGAKLVAAWSGLAPTATTVAAAPTTVNVGQSVTLTADVGSAATTTAIGGTVTFTFETFAGSVGESYSDAGPAPADGGVQDESWVLGTVDVTALSNAPDAGSSEHATAQLTTAIPPGLYGKAYVVAMYNGDSKYLGSRSSPELVTVVGATLTIDPKAITLAPFGTTTFTTSGGAPPVTWGIIGTDSTCNASYQCSQVTAETTTKAFFQAGATAGGHRHSQRHALGCRDVPDVRRGSRGRAGQSAHHTLRRGRLRRWRDRGRGRRRWHRGRCRPRSRLGDRRRGPRSGLGVRGDRLRNHDGQWLRLERRRRGQRRLEHFEQLRQLGWHDQLGQLEWHRELRWLERRELRVHQLG